MQASFKKEDLRVVKTHKALINAFYTLLCIRSFEKITVNDLCEEALISRVTFYAHFNDKYALLKYWLVLVSNDIIRAVRKYGDMDAEINQIINENFKVVVNLFDNANSEVLELLHDFMRSMIDSVIITKADGSLSHNQTVLSNFCAGGMVSLLKLHVKSKYAPGTNMINSYFFDMLESMIEWDSTQAPE